MPTTKNVKLINKKEFAKTALDKKSQTFVVYVIALKTLEITIHLFWSIQILQKTTKLDVF